MKPFNGLKALKFTTGLFLYLLLYGFSAKAQQPVADFTPSVTTGCIPLTVNFTNLSTQANSYYWDFGNGNTSTLQNPTTVYLNSGYYTVTLVAINTINGNRDTMRVTDLIFIDVEPVPDFMASPLSGCAGSNFIQFTNQSQFATSYTWDFGDGTYSTAVNPVHNYLVPGVYTVKLIAANADGCTKVMTKAAYVTIHPKPDAAFTVNQQSTCDQNQIFTFNSTGSGVTSWNWDFGDGNTASTQTPSHTYSSPGSYTVTLIVSNQYGCTDTVSESSFINIGPTLVPTFDVNSQGGCPPFTASFTSTVTNGTGWLWDFGDGTTSTLESPTHVYNTPGTYSISLTVTTLSGCNGSVTLPGYITVDTPPTASFTVSSAVGCDAVSPVFTNTSSGAVTYLWDFGNGITSTDPTPTVTFGTPGTYDVTLIAYSAYGCADTMVIPGAVVVNAITANFTATPRFGCAPLPVDFTGISNPAAVSWQWDFGDGNTSNVQNPTNIYTSTGMYQVTLIVTSADGCVDTLTRPNYIRLYPDSVPYTVPDTILVCLPPGGVSFTDPTMGSNYWHWDFGDGDTSDVANPSHNYSAPGIYTVTLQTAMPGGCSQTFNPYAIVEVLPFDVNPISTLTASPCGPFTVQYDNSTAGVASYLWDFGDGTTSTLPNPSHTYAQPGTYTISLLLTAMNGCSSNLSTTVSFGHDNPITISDTDICLGDAIDFTLTPLNDFISATWYFGDGDSSTALQPSHVYAATGNYTVTVTVMDTDSCVFTYTSVAPVVVSDPQPSFVVNQSTTGCIPFTIQFTNTSTGATSYWWDFGNGAVSAAANPSQQFSAAGVYTVSLTATANGCSRTYTVPDMITANQAFANFTFTPSTGCQPLTVNFTDISVNPVSWQWNFGDGNTSTQQNPVHTYTSIPTSGVSLTIVDINGCTRTRTKPAPNVIVPEISVVDSAGCRPLTVQFGSSTTAQSYLWDFGDGGSSTLQNPTHTYTQAGNYTVTLTCVLASGCSTTVVKPNFITVNAPVSDFMTPTVSVCAPSLVNFVNQSTGAVAWLWQFGDGTSSTNENPSHIYNVPGTYTVTLISYTVDGCSDTLVKQDYIVVPGTYSSFILGSSVNCLNTSVQFIDQSINATSWFWNFGDGFTSTQQNPTHVYADSGSYTVTLITSDSTGCSSFFSFPNPIVIHPAPVASGVVPAITGCLPVSVSFTNTSQNTVSGTWHFGNGDSSQTGNTSYVYQTPGVYSPYLVVYAQSGCSDTASFQGAITVIGNPTASITASDTSGCMPLTVSFTNGSQGLSNASYQWDFGNGINSTNASPSVTFTGSGYFDVQMIVTNDGLCHDTASVTIHVFDKPVASGVIQQSSGCAPHTVTFINQSVNYDSVVWYFGDGNTASSDTAVHTYSTAGTYNPYLIASTGNGCSDTLYFSNPIEVYPVPSANFSVNQNSGCPGTTFEFTNLSTPGQGLTYQWNISGQSFTAANPQVVMNTPGFHDVSLVVTSSFGCTDTLIQTAYIEVFDTLPPLVSPIMSVSVLNNTQVEIIWQNNAATDLAAYVLYRRAPGGSFVEIYRDLSPQNSSVNVTSSYIDNNLSTLNTVYTYKLQTIDRCSYTLPLSALVAHTTINITAVAQADDIRVSWTPYIGCTVTNYELTRVNLVDGTSTLVATVPATQRQYLDQNFYCPHEYSYRVEATSLCGTNYSSLSDTSNATPENILEEQKVAVVRSTVINDREILTEWLPPVLAPDRVGEYHILRSTDSLNYTQVAIVPDGVFSYIDSDVNVHEREYYYKVEVISDCGVTGSPSNKSSSIWLQSKYFRDEKTRLWWTPYKDWEIGVDYYTIEKLNPNGQWERIRTVGGNELETILDQ